MTTPVTRSIRARLSPSSTEAFKEETAEVSVTVSVGIAGVFAFDADNAVLAFAFFPKDGKKTAQRHWRLLSGEVVKEVAQVVSKTVRKGEVSLVFEDKVLAKAVRDQFSVTVTIKANAGDYIRRQGSELAIKYGLLDTLQEYYTLVHDVTTEFSKARIREASGRKDLLIVQAVLTLDDLDRTSNLFASRVREWYGYHFPELTEYLEKNETYTNLVAKLGHRSKFTGKTVAKEKGLLRNMEGLPSASKNSIGADFERRDLTPIRSLAETLRRLHDARNIMERYIDETMEDFAPNVRELAGASLGARLIAEVGSLENLAKKSSSTIQIIGAEKALFRSLRTGTRPPKHGLIFQHKQIHQAPRWQRGKIARALAGKLAIAARIDFFREKHEISDLNNEFMDRVAEIKVKYSEPPDRSKRRGE
jgi:nucleolar protein 56